MFEREGEARPQDPVHIQVDEPNERAYWTEALEVDEAALRGAIQAVGFAANDVRDYLKQRRAATHAG